MENIYLPQIQIYECLKGNPMMITVNAFCGNANYVPTTHNQVSNYKYTGCKAQCRYLRLTGTNNTVTHLTNYFQCKMRKSKNSQNTKSI
jgi:hypothetical protein